LFNDNELSLDWDAVWESATSRDDHGWSAELAIPLDVLRFDVDSVARWHVYVQRYISRRKESDEWPYLSRDTAAQVSRFAPVDGIDMLRPRRAIYLVPYVAGSTIYARRPTGDAGDPSGTDVSGKVGGDAKLAITPALTLDVTVNPEFSQIEADELVL